MREKDRLLTGGPLILQKMEPLNPPPQRLPKPPKRVDEKLLREFMVKEFQALGLPEKDARAMMGANQPVTWVGIEDRFLEAHPEHPYHRKLEIRKYVIVWAVVIAVALYLYFN